MRGRYLEVTFRKGKPMAAYLYLPRRSNAHSVRTTSAGSGIFVDFDSNDVVLGVEITSPQAITLDTINRVLRDIGQSAVSAEEIAPLQAA
jgi:uncharacterized protein YuzE